MLWRFSSVSRRPILTPGSQLMTMQRRDSGTPSAAASMMLIAGLRCDGQRRVKITVATQKPVGMPLLR